MNFPHPALRQAVAHDRNDHRAMLAMATARQAKSRTAHAMAVAGGMSSIAADPRHDMVRQMIRYFGSGKSMTNAPFGAFFTASCSQETDEPIAEQSVYQNASTNIKAHDLEGDRTGEQSSNAGHGTTRTLC